MQSFAIHGNASLRAGRPDLFLGHRLGHLMKPREMTLTLGASGAHKLLIGPTRGAHLTFCADICSEVSPEIAPPVTVLLTPKTIICKSVLQAATLSPMAIPQMGDICCLRAQFNDRIPAGHSREGARRAHALISES